MQRVYRREQVLSTISSQEFEEWHEQVHNEPTGESSDVFDRCHDTRRAASPFFSLQSMIPFRNRLKSLFGSFPLQGCFLRDFQDRASRRLVIQEASFWTHEWQSVQCSLTQASQAEKAQARQASLAQAPQAQEPQARQGKPQRRPLPLRPFLPHDLTFYSTSLFL